MIVSINMKLNFYEGISHIFKNSLHTIPPYFRNELGSSTKRKFWLSYFRVVVTDAIGVRKRPR